MLISWCAPDKVRYQSLKFNCKYYITPFSSTTQPFLPSSEIPWGKLRMAINVIDAEIDKFHMLRYMSIAYEVEQDQLAQSEPQTLATIIKRFEMSAVRRVGKLNSSDLEDD